MSDRPKSIPYGDFTREANRRHRVVSYNDVVGTPRLDRHGEPIPAMKPTVDFHDTVTILQPYVGTRIGEQLKAVVPLAIYLALFQLVLLRQGIQNPWSIGGGLLAVVVGLMLFLEGLKLGLMPFGEIIGQRLPVHSPLIVVLLFACTLGMGVTFAEPAIGALKQAGALVSPDGAPILFGWLNYKSGFLVGGVALGVGIAGVLGFLRLVKNWSLKIMVFATVIPTLCITAFLMTQGTLSQALALAWDCGAVTTGPVTVPLMLATGIGVAASVSNAKDPLAGFGLVTLASIMPIFMVCLLTLVLGTDGLIVKETVSAASAGGQEWWEKSPFNEIVLGVRAIVPLVVFLYLVLRFVVKEKLPHPWIIRYGLILCLSGMVIFNLGLNYGLTALGQQTGGLVPNAFHAGEGASAMYPYGVGLALALGFTLILGVGSTMAEPALNALGHTVEVLTNGALQQKSLVRSVSVGVGLGLMGGIGLIIFDISFGPVIIALYCIALTLTAMAEETLICVAWDSAGVTTGPVTVPLVLAMGVAFGEALEAEDGFGMLAMASAGPIIAVLLQGVISMRRARRESGANS